jgi:hypothetical protein
VPAAPIQRVQNAGIVAEREGVIKVIDSVKIN